MIDLIIKNIVQRKLRTSLTIFGIGLGIFAIIVMGAMSEYFSIHSEKTLRLFSDKITVIPESGFFGGNFEESKIREIRRIPGVTNSYGTFQMPLDSDGSLISTDFVMGLSPENQKFLFLDTKIKSGRFLIVGDRYKAVIGTNIARKLSLNVGDNFPIKFESSSRTRTKIFTVVGILEFTSSDFDYVVAIPLDTAQKLYDAENKVSYVFVVPNSDVDAEELSKRIELSVSNVKAISPQELRRQTEQSLVVINLITISSAILATIIGGLSVMNTMFMSISERTKDFGLMKAFGAEMKDILFLTLGESALMGILGGFLGIVGGGIFIYYLNDYLASQGTVLFAITLRLVVGALLFATILGAISGLVPAYRAAKMSPMEALKYG